MGCAAGIVKFLVFATNFVFALAGLGLITVGVLYKLHIGEVTDAIPSDYVGISLAPILTIVLGSIIFCISFFGCCGAIRESPCLLTTYAVILLVIFILQIALGVYAFLEIKDKPTFDKKVAATLKKVFDGAKNGNKEANETVALIQHDLLDCCGFDGPNYWGDNIPESCYNEQKELYKDGCEDKFKAFLNSSINIIGIVVLSISAIEVLGSIFGLCLANTLRNDIRRGRY